MKPNTPKSIMTVGFSLTAIVTTIVTVPIALTVFESSYASQVKGNISNQNFVINPKFGISESEFSDLVSKVKIREKYKKFSASYLLNLAKDPNYPFNLLQALDFGELEAKGFLASIDIKNAKVQQNSITDLIVSATNKKYHLTYSKKITVSGFGDFSGSDNFDLDTNKSKIMLNSKKMVFPTQFAYKLEDLFQEEQKSNKNNFQAFLSALAKLDASLDLVNAVGEPTFLKADAKVSPVFKQNELASQEKQLAISEAEKKRATENSKVFNLKFTSVDDESAKLAIEFSFEKAGKVQNFNLEVQGLTKISKIFDVAAKKIAEKLNDYISLRPEIQTTLISENKTLSEVLYGEKSEAIATTIEKIIRKSNLEKAEGSGFDADKDKEKIYQYDSFLSYFNFKKDPKNTFEVDINDENLDSIKVNLTGFEFPKNLDQNEKDKLIKEGKIRLIPSIVIYKKMGLKSPYLQEINEKLSTYTNDLKTHLELRGKSGSLKFSNFLVSESNQSTIEFAVPKLSNHQKLLFVAFSNPDVQTENNEFVKRINFVYNEKSPALPTVEVKKIINEIINLAKDNKFSENQSEITKKLYTLDYGYAPSDEEHKNYQELLKQQAEKLGKVEIIENNSKKDEETEKTKPKPEEKPKKNGETVAGSDKNDPKDQTSKLEESQSGDSKNKGNSQSETSSPESQAGKNSQVTNQNGQNSGQQDSAAQSTSQSDARIQVTKFQEEAVESSGESSSSNTEASPNTSPVEPKKDEKTPKKTEKIVKNAEITKLKNNSSKIGLNLYNLLNPENYKSASDSKIEFSVDDFDQNSLEIKAILKSNSKTLAVAKLIIDNLDSSFAYDVSQKFQSSIFIDGRRSPIINVDTRKIESLRDFNREDLKYKPTKIEVPSLDLLDPDEQKYVKEHKNEYPEFFVERIKEEIKQIQNGILTNNSFELELKNPDEDATKIKNGLLLMSLKMNKIDDYKRHYFFSSKSENPRGFFIQRVRMKTDEISFKKLNKNIKTAEKPVYALAFDAFSSVIIPKDQANFVLSYIDPENVISDKKTLKSIDKDGNLNDISQLKLEVGSESKFNQEQKIPDKFFANFDAEATLVLRLIFENNTLKLRVYNQNAKNPFTDYLESTLDLESFLDAYKNESKEDLFNLDFAKIGPHLSGAQMFLKGFMVFKNPEESETNQTLSARTKTTDSADEIGTNFLKQYLN
ncbi:P110/LppT family adhesin N-terminal domain [Mesomycoplasma dispar]|uniref:Uncharacterized protein n=1 Tax=Mesomycoplasma dispar TaxID=86660 RepID=A0ABN5DVT4_9BACT|nr:P110/LppT family adhesin N-terminal domain [Mesomycoplasma dispar]ATP59573.1 hypothetical protein CSW10_01235 [Mesomycoplasma dispar]